MKGDNGLEAAGKGCKIEGHQWEAETLAAAGNWKRGRKKLLLSPRPVNPRDEALRQGIQLYSASLLTKKMED